MTCHALVVRNKFVPVSYYLHYDSKYKQSIPHQPLFFPYDEVNKTKKMQLVVECNAFSLDRSKALTLKTPSMNVT